MLLSVCDAHVKSANGIKEGKESSFENLMYGLLLSGLAMQMMGNSRPASGAEHHISHIIEMSPAGLEVCSDTLHGEKVGVGTLMAMAEYHKLCEKTDRVFRDYKPYDTDFLRGIFKGEMLEEIVKENENDAAFGITTTRLNECWEEIRFEISKLPDIEWLCKLYSELGIKSKLSDISVNDEKAEALLKYSPAVRNRLTLMRLRKCL